MKKSTLKSIVFFYLGFSLTAFTNLSFDNWRFYVIIIPTAILFAVSDGVDDEE